MLLTQGEWRWHDWVSFLHEVVQLKVQGIYPQLPSGVLHDGLHHPGPVDHARSPDRRVGVGVSADTKGDKPTVGDLVAALTKHGSKYCVNLVKTPASVTVKVAVNSLNFSIGGDSNLETQQ